MIDQEKYENMLWMDLISNVDELTRISKEVWKNNHDHDEYSYTNKLQFDYTEILKLEPTLVPFHTPNISGLGQTTHDGMMRNNDIGRHEFDPSHPIHTALQEKFNITHTQVYLNLQHPGDVCGIHIDKYRSHFTLGKYDLTKLRTKDIYSGVVFLQDWEVGQTFMTGRSNITDWQSGDSYTFPWYVPHGSANASAKSRYLLQFVGVLV